jgi:chromosome segregation ATPase
MNRGCLYMHRLLFILSLLIAAPAFGQTSSIDSQTLQALLEEVRQLRHDLQTTTVAAQRVQIALYRLQRQEAAVTRATQALSDARSKLASVLSNKGKIAAHIQEVEEIEKRSQNPDERSHIDEVELPQLKSQLETLGNEEQQAQTRKSDAEEQLRTEQSKLDAVHNLLNRLDNSLEEIGRQPVRSPHQAN